MALLKKGTVTEIYQEKAVPHTLSARRCRQGTTDKNKPRRPLPFRNGCGVPRCRREFTSSLQQITDFRQQHLFFRRCGGEQPELLLPFSSSAQLDNQFYKQEDREGNNQESPKWLAGSYHNSTSRRSNFFSIHHLGSISSPTSNCKIHTTYQQADRGITTSATIEETIFPNAPPMITPTAMSTTLPFMAKALKSCKNELFPIFSII